jgi:hypothetical protein
VGKQAFEAIQIKTQVKSSKPDKYEEGIILVVTVKGIFPL